MKCFYIKRGSFSGLKNFEFAEMLVSNPSLKDKCFSCIVKLQGNWMENIKNQETLESWKIEAAIWQYHVFTVYSCYAEALVV